MENTDFLYNKDYYSKQLGQKHLCEKSEKKLSYTEIDDGYILPAQAGWSGGGGGYIIKTKLS